MNHKTEPDCIIIGAGFSGSVVARRMAENGKKVLLLERRNHIAGNMYDEKDAYGILVQKYGPHIFHTNEKQVYDFITAYGEWTNYSHTPMVEMNGTATPSPANFKTIDVLYGPNEAAALKATLAEQYVGKKSVTILELYDSKNRLIKQYAEKLFELNYRPYTVKQWGTPPEQVDPATLKRVPVRLDYSEGYFDDIYQCMPKNGYTGFFKTLLDHENITIQLNINALDYLNVDVKGGRPIFEQRPVNCPVVYTGSIDELLDYCYGELPYRSIRFELKTFEQDSFQEASVVAYPLAKGYTRITEFKKLPPQTIAERTTIAYEYPLAANRTQNHEPYYPIITEANTALYNKYRAALQIIPNLYLCGRLADYKYYNMDAAIMRAFEVLSTVKLIKQEKKDLPTSHYKC